MRGALPGTPARLEGVVRARRRSFRPPPCTAPPRHEPPRRPSKPPNPIAIIGQVEPARHSDCRVCGVYTPSHGLSHAGAALLSGAPKATVTMAFSAHSPPVSAGPAPGPVWAPASLEHAPTAPVDGPPARDSAAPVFSFRPRRPHGAHGPRTGPHRCRPTRMRLPSTTGRRPFPSRRRCPSHGRRECCRSYRARRRSRRLLSTP